MALSADYILTSLTELYGTDISAADVKGWCAMNGTTYQTVTKKLEQYKTGRGKWNLTVSEAREQMEQSYASITRSLVPAKDQTFVPFGNYTDLKKIIQSRIFYPTFITGMSGNGKTFGIEQACAKTKREVIRVNLTAETDEDDLIGGFRLVNGETKFFKGPVIKAMEKGAVLLLDEIDLANPAKVMCLQSILEGKGYFIKKTGEFVTPKKGFTAIATANTKGKGSEDGRFIGTNILNEAFLERFPVTVEQEYPSVSIETKILERVFDSLDIKDTKFAKRLVEWADIIRKTFYDGGVDEIISTRRLVHIAKAYSIFGDRMKAINLCINRFDEDTKLSFSDLYTKVDSEALGEANGYATAVEEEVETDEDITLDITF